MSTNVHGRNYGTHCPGEAGRTLCKRYAEVDVNCTTRGPGQEAQASCKLCQRRLAARAAAAGTDARCAAECGRPAKPAGSRGFRSSLCDECALYKVQEQTRERVRRHRARRKA